MMTFSAMAQIIVTAHRGASAYAPENTLEAVARALEIGVDRIEVDVATSKDGIVVCLHDKTLDRTCQVDGDVRDFTFEELSAVKANKGFEADFPEAVIPSLESIINLINAQCELVVEIKSGDEHYPQIEEKVAALIAEHDAYKWTLVHSFNDKVLDRLEKIDSRVRLQKLFVFRWRWPAIIQDFKFHAGKTSNYQVEAFGVASNFVKPKLVEEIHELGKQIHVWTVDEPEEMEKLIEMGVDGIITNKPDVLKQVLKGNE
ncbi:MAG: glycerophosphoryl diester phosphodiesterase [Flavobacteriales bacterium]|jgi:glycerophosphoryl diester phosphodiesterase